MGKGEGLTLHTGNMIFEQRSGVCKDIAGMMVTMTYLDPSRAAETQATAIKFDEKTLIQIGRDASNDVVLDSPRISRYHAQIERVGDVRQARIDLEAEVRGLQRDRGDEDLAQVARAQDRYRRPERGDHDQAEHDRR